MGDTVSTSKREPNTGSFKKGRKRSGGRAKGTPNKVTRTLVEAIDHAFTELGGADWLAKTAKKRPDAFLSLLGKRIPRDLKLGGDAQIHITVTTGVPPSDAN